MRFISFLFTLLFLVVAHTTYAQTPKPQTVERASSSMTRTGAAGTNNGLTDAEILKKADQLRYFARYQDYSNIVTALADSELKVEQRIATMGRLSSAYFADQPVSVSLPNNLLNPDGSPMSDAEMAAFISRLTNTSDGKTNAGRSKSTTTDCFAKFYELYFINTPHLRLVANYVIIYPPYMNNIPECASVPPFSARAVSLIGVN